MKEIKLTRGCVALVDDEDFEYLSQWKWYAGGREGNIYARRSISKHKKILMHRLIMNTPDDMEVDHRDRNKLNNQRSNLRNCNHLQNMVNREPEGASQYKGVSFAYRRGKKLIVSQIRIEGKSTHIGYFKTEEEAARRYNEKALELHGEFAYLNEL